jgi:antitoxin ChpS
MHTTNLRKVGGSIMLAVPPAILDILHLHAGATVGLAVDHGRLVVEPTLRPRYSLDSKKQNRPDNVLPSGGS